jgi:excisionase family DNA binding protein
MENKLAYSVREAMRATGISRAQIVAALKDGSLPAVKIGVKKKILVDDLTAWLKTFPKLTTEKSQCP